MKQLFITLMFAMLCSFSVSAQSQKSFIKSIELNAATVELQLPGEVTAKEWDKDFVRITVSVDLLNSSEEILKRLASVGRYELQSREEGGILIIELPKIAQVVAIKGTTLQEVLKFEVMYPQNTGINITQPAYFKTSASL